jgi:hypothetical protein
VNEPTSTPEVERIITLGGRTYRVLTVMACIHTERGAAYFMASRIVEELK